MQHRPCYQRGLFVEVITPQTESRSASQSRKRRRGGNLRLRFPGGEKASLKGRQTVRCVCWAGTADVTFVQPKGTLLPHCLDKYVHGTFLRSPMSSLSRDSARGRTNMSPTTERRIQSVSASISGSPDTHGGRFVLSSLWYQAAAPRGLVQHLRRSQRRAR